MKETQYVPDSLAFSIDCLRAHGALVEQDGQSALVIASPKEAQQMGVDEAFQLETGTISQGGTPCGLGSPLLDYLVSREKAHSPIHSAFFYGQAKANQAKLLVERYSMRNGLCEVHDVGIRDISYLFLSVAYVAESDDRHEGVVSVVVRSDNGAFPDETWSQRFDLMGTIDVVPGPGTWPSRTVWQAISKITEEAIEKRIASFVTEANHRHQRDYDRLVEYYENLAKEAKNSKRKIDTQTLAHKIDRIRTERDAKISELTDRYTVRVTNAPACALLVTTPCAVVRVRFRRRKEVRIVELVLPAGSSALDRLPCEYCMQAVAKPALCDRELHILCERCAPQSQGRFSCPCCV